jgi:hypothetical protein
VWPFGFDGDRGRFVEEGEGAGAVGETSLEEDALGEGAAWAGGCLEAGASGGGESSNFV